MKSQLIIRIISIVHFLFAMLIAYGGISSMGRPASTIPVWVSVTAYGVLAFYLGLGAWALFYLKHMGRMFVFYFDLFLATLIISSTVLASIATHSVNFDWIRAGSLIALLVFSMIYLKLPQVKKIFVD
ncbi:hypothetical protein N9K06_00340 [Omnitrophica bacterium]|nr:hypothetical protein [Candidatus Omnitrophota bacterium]